MANARTYPVSGGNLLVRTWPVKHPLSIPIDQGHYIPVTMRASDTPRAAASAAITVQCRFFARYAELLGRDSRELSLPAPATVQDAVRALRTSLERGSQLPATPLTAVNCAHAGGDTPLADGDELALLPPLAGG